MNQRLVTAIKVSGFVLTIFILGCAKAWADDPLQATTDFSDRLIAILKGPVTKGLGALLLIVAVGGLLRGRHKLAISCGVAFVILLFLPILLQHLGGSS